MVMLLRKFDPNSCCLCGQSENLTGEHKIKMSALKGEFGNAPTYIGVWGDPSNPPKLAQSPKSKFFHFKGKICKDCNGAKTQKADRSFDEYHEAVKLSIQNKDQTYWKDGIFEHPDFHSGSEKSEWLFRYFAKILCCRLAESEGPTPIYLARHAIGEFAQNRVWLRVRRDPIQEQFTNSFGSWPYAAHGGLVIYSNKTNGEPKAFHSTISIGPVQYIFWFRLHWLERLELRFRHRKFYRFCKFTALDKSNMIIDDEQKDRLGFL